MATARVPKSKVQFASAAGRLIVERMLQGRTGLIGQLGSSSMTFAAVQASKVRAEADGAPPRSAYSRVTVRAGPARWKNRLSERPQRDPWLDRGLAESQQEIEWKRLL
jgi:hypothetical protein